MKRIVSIVLALALSLSLCVPAFADGQRFGDVSTGHWAYADIEALAEGGLVQGKGGGVFDPDANVTVGELATIICRAKGMKEGTLNGKWYGVAAKTMVDNGYVYGNSWKVDGTDQKWERPCSRELAVYMVIRALGVPPTATNTGKNAADFTDYANITCKEEVITAVKYGIINGFPDGTFGPDKSLTRAQICAILNRAGFTTAADVPEEYANAKTNEEIFLEIEATGLFTKETSGNLIKLTAKEHKYAGLTVTYNTATDKLWFKAREVINSIVQTEDGKVILEDGSIGNADWYFYDANGKALYASGLGYESRKLLQQVLKIAFPASANEAISTAKAVMTPPFVYSGESEYPSAVKWLDGHCVVFQMGGAGNPGQGYSIAILPMGDENEYTQCMAKPMPARKMEYDYAVLGGLEDGICEYNGMATAYELNRW